MKLIEMKEKRTFNLLGLKETHMSIVKNMKHFFKKIAKLKTYIERSNQA